MSPACTKSQELLLLERIQAEAAAFYSYTTHSPATALQAPLEQPKERKGVRANLTAKYDKLSLDELAGKKQNSDGRSLDFKVLSLDEIRAKKSLSEPVVQSAPAITLNLNRKRKLSTQEINTTTGNKMIKVIRSNSIVYKKFDKGAPPQPHQRNKGWRGESASRKRTLSELSDVCDEQEDELVDNCHEFKRIKIGERPAKPRLIRNRHTSGRTNSESNEDLNECANRTDDDSVQFVSITNGRELDEATEADTEVIDLDSAKMAEPIDIVDLCDEAEEGDDVTITDLAKNVPDVVASCQKNLGANDRPEEDIINDIDALLDDDL